MSMLWARRSDGLLVNADEVAAGLGPDDPHPRGFVCASTECEARLTFYREHPQGDTVIPPHFQLTTLGAGQTARHDEGCEVEDGSWMTPAGEQPGPAPRTRPRRLRFEERVHRLALRRTPDPHVPAPDDAHVPPRAAIGARPGPGPGSAADRARRLTSASAVGQRHREIREDDEGAVVLFSGREVLWRNFVYEPHRYGELVERFRFFGTPPHRVALIVRPVGVDRRDDGYWRLRCAPFWSYPSDDIAVPMLVTQRRELFGELDFERLYVVLAELTIRQYEREYDDGDGPFQATYFFGTITDAVDFGELETVEEYAEFQARASDEAA
jgi:hypothetical protein